MEEQSKERLAKELMGLVPLMHKIVFSCEAGGLGVPPLPPKQMQTLLILSCFEQLSMTQLTERVGTSKQQLTQLVDALVEKGLVARASSEENRRLVLIALTDEGKGLIERIVHDKSVEVEQMFSTFTQAERDTLVEAVRLLRRAMVLRLGGAVPQPETIPM